MVVRPKVTVELAEQAILHGEPSSGTDTLLPTDLGEAADRLPTAVSLGGTTTVKGAVNAGLSFSSLLTGASATDPSQCRLPALRPDRATLRHFLSVNNRRGPTRQSPATVNADAVLASTG